MILSFPQHKISYLFHYKVTQSILFLCSNGIYLQIPPTTINYFLQYQIQAVIMDSNQSSDINPIQKDQNSYVELSSLSLFQNVIHSNSYESNDDYLEFIADKGKHAILNAPILEKQQFESSIQMNRLKLRLLADVQELQISISKNQNANRERQANLQGKVYAIEVVENVFEKSQPRQIENNPKQKIYENQKAIMEVREKAILQADQYLTEKIVYEQQQFKKQKQKLLKFQRNKQLIDEKINEEFQHQKLSRQSEKKQKMLEEQQKMEQDCIKKYTKYLEQLN